MNITDPINNSSVSLSSQDFSVQPQAAKKTTPPPFPQRSEILNKLETATTNKDATIVRFNALQRNRDLYIGAAAVVGIGAVIGAIAGACPPVLALLFLTALFVYLAKKADSEMVNEDRELENLEKLHKNTPDEFIQASLKFDFEAFKGVTKGHLGNRVEPAQVNLLKSIQKNIEVLVNLNITREDANYRDKQNILKSWQRALIDLYKENEPFSVYTFDNISSTLQNFLNRDSIKKLKGP